VPSTHSDLSHRGDLARRITARREELGLSRDELARRASMDAAYLEYLEQRSGAAVTATALLRLAEALGTTVEALAGGDVERPPRLGGDARPPEPVPLAEGEARRLLEPGGVGRIVFSSARGPVAQPVNFVLEHDEVVIHVARQLAETLASEGVVGFEADRVDEAQHEGWSVLVTGPARLVEAGGPGSGRVEVRVRVDELTGRMLRHR